MPGWAQATSGPTSDVIDDESHDEALGAEPVTPARRRPAGVHRSRSPTCSRTCAEHGVPVTARGSGSGLSGACIPPDGGVVVSFQRMNRDPRDRRGRHTSPSCSPGVQLDQLDAALATVGLAYPVYPGEYSATIGGNIATNAGGMQAVKHGVTRHHVLGLELALATGEVIRTGGRIVKASSGYDLTQLVIGSEGTLALVTEATLKLVPRPAFSATVLAPFPTLDEVAVRGAEGHHQRSRAVDPRVHRHADDGGDPARVRPRARHSRRCPGDRARVPRRPHGERPRRPARRGRAGGRRAPRRARRGRRVRAAAERGRAADRGPREGVLAREVERRRRHRRHRGAATDDPGVHGDGARDRRGERRMDRGLRPRRRRQRAPRGVPEGRRRRASS